MPDTQLSTLFERNAEFVRSGAGARKHIPELPFLPWQHAYVLTCIDPRTDPSAFFGVALGDAIVARTVGGRVTPAVVQDLAYICYLVETKAPAGPYFEVAVVHHTDCGLAKLQEDEFRSLLARFAGYRPTWSVQAFKDPHDSVRESLRRVRDSPFLHHTDAVRGFIMDVESGLLEEMLGAGATGRRLAFTVPAGCPVQFLRIVDRPPATPHDSGWITPPRIARIS